MTQMEPLRQKLVVRKFCHPREATGSHGSEAKPVYQIQALLWSSAALSKQPESSFSFCRSSGVQKQGALGWAEEFIKAAHLAESHD